MPNHELTCLASFVYVVCSNNFYSVLQDNHGFWELFCGSTIVLSAAIYLMFWPLLIYQVAISVMFQFFDFKTATEPPDCCHYSCKLLQLIEV